MAHSLKISAAGDSAMVVEFGDSDDSANDRAIALAARIRAVALEGVRDVVPALKTVGVHFDPLRVTRNRLSSVILSMQDDQDGQRPDSTTLHQIPVCYGGAYGPDLADVAGLTGLSEDAVVSEHAEPVYRVQMLGFLPGFAYMGPVRPAIAIPRRSTPRVAIPAGSVAIAGPQTGIYPSETPGGWHIIGRTWVRPFDMDRVTPFLFSPGDRVQFRAVPAARFGQQA